MKKINRRKLIIGGTAAAAVGTVSARAFWPFGDSGTGGAADITGRIFRGDAPDKPWKWSKEGFLYVKLEQDRVMCSICPNACVLSPGDRSVCRSRVNIDGVLYSLTYGNPCSVHVDPIEKKPLYHFRPQSRAFSVATTGCNFRCLNCQNWEISQVKPEEVRQYEIFPPEVVTRAKEAGCSSIAYTYSEAITYFEYMHDTAKLARQDGLANLLISNGYINRTPLLELCKVLDAANINLKSLDDGIYRKLNGGRLQPVLDALKTMHEQGVHLEITNLVVPGYVDKPDMVKEMCGWILKNLGPDHPLHFLRFFPKYKLDRLPPTPVSILVEFRELAMREGIRYAYVGNVADHPGNNTYCHQCQKLLVERTGYTIPVYNLVGNQCKFCDTVIPGVWT
ncbi:MAG: AmmeMemoRadiSam system radical SAM enzyme [Proteobacteria bacterium]|nr:AmmeMemoRadiSam system radical SAM enzyme [Pseudomonadota bacterium]MBU1736718.1 AmmeMemoRadiSam system radical SAM enzyme [Pseudomonadota bacterium]